VQTTSNVTLEYGSGDKPAMVAETIGGHSS
jgi:hypothetical protein